MTGRPDDAQTSRAFLLFPGAPGYGNMGVNGAALRYAGQGNFLVRARRHFIEPGTLTVVIDAPSDMQSSFPYSFRASARYGADVRAVLETIEGRFGKLDWSFVGTSEGTVSATHAARMLGDVAHRLFLTSSIVTGGGQGPALSENDVRAVTVPVLWVHHVNDPCWATRYSAVQRIAANLKQPLITVSGAENARGDYCGARSEHGFAGTEIKTIAAIRTWVATGQALERVSLH